MSKQYDFSFSKNRTWSTITGRKANILQNTKKVVEKNKLHLKKEVPQNCPGDVSEVWFIFFYNVFFIISFSGAQ